MTPIDQPTSQVPIPPQWRSWLRRTLVAAATVAAALVIALQAGVFGNDPGQRPGQTNENPTGLTSYAVGSRPAAPDLSGTTLSGETLALNSLRGRIVILNVWGSWCNPCRAEMPELVKVANENRNEPVRFVGINTRDNAAAARAFVKSFSVPFPSLIDKDGQLMLTFAGLVPVNAVPSTVVIAPDGRVAARVVGRISYSTLTGLIDDLQRETGATPAGQK